MITGGYCINPTGLHPIGSDWPGYWASLTVYDQWDCFSRSSADRSEGHPWTRFESVAGDVQFLKAAVEAQQMHPVSMGVYQFSTFCRDTVTNALYLSVPQTGCQVFFRLQPC